MRKCSKKHFANNDFHTIFLQKKVVYDPHIAV